MFLTIGVVCSCDCFVLNNLQAVEKAVVAALEKRKEKESSAALVDEAQAICEEVPMNRHIFNLGHGILQHTPPDHVTQLLSVIRDHGAGR